VLHYDMPKRKKTKAQGDGAKCPELKGLSVHPKIKILSSFTHPHVYSKPVTVSVPIDIQCIFQNEP